MIVLLRGGACAVCAVDFGMAPSGLQCSRFLFTAGAVRVGAGARRRTNPARETWGDGALKLVS